MQIKGMSLWLPIAHHQLGDMIPLRNQPKENQKFTLHLYYTAHYYCTRSEHPGCLFFAFSTPLCLLLFFVFVLYAGS